MQAGEFLVGIGNGTNSIDGCVINRPGGYDYHLNASSTQAYLYFFSNTPKSLGGCGLQVFNAKGEIIFDSNAKQAIVLACGGEGTSAYGNQLAICCGGDTIEADNNDGASQYITTLGPWTRYKTETTYEQKWVEYQDYVIENEYVNGKLTPVGHWVTKKRLDYVPVTKQVPEYYYTYSRTSNVWWDYEKYYYNLCLKTGVASQHTHRVDIDSDSKTWTDKLEGKVNGKVIYNEESINANIYTMRLETGDYINIKVENKRADKIDLNIGDAVSVTIEKEG